jgi:hypothetical protein
MVKKACHPNWNIQGDKPVQYGTTKPWLALFKEAGRGGRAGGYQYRGVRSLLRKRCQNCKNRNGLAYAGGVQPEQAAVGSRRHINSTTFSQTGRNLAAVSTAICEP